ncbi:DUF4336 domain-containing protein [Thiorhodococcus mannitoliphagus]|uniref:DUF4336 domain-containing protein n=1 Tax=Thiorhodococcus mannitoliphagus TaxID=329406 RepID=A0A6P1DXF3_9GAMM|nr:DUF4336 domain-containing protein [Thiorhodococcus mannitoliphagus]NEX22160.1 DUF4336 domain-containing protein [Thiorhodococcus mannitoliphagus]
MLSEYVKDAIWIHEYPVRYGGMDLFGRMTLIRLGTSELIVHDPCRIDAATQREIDQIGEVRYIIAPGSYHHLFVSEFQSHYPSAETFLCPGLERKRPDIRFDWILGNRPDPRWAGVLEQVIIQGPRLIWEVPFFHRSSKTLILVDLLENIGDDYSHAASLQLKLWWKLVFRMWNHPKAAPEYQIAWGRRDLVRRGLEQVLAWEPERIILSHGELIERNAMAVLRSAWERVLQG